MRWEVAQGDDLQTTIVAAASGDRGAKKILAKAPQLSAYELYFYNAFGELDTMRMSAGMTRGKIPWSAIVNYCEWHGLSRSQTTIMLRVIQLMDSTIAEAAAEKRQEAAK